MDLEYIAKLLVAIAQAGPAVISGVEQAMPYAEAIASTIGNGGKPPDQSDWDALHVRLDAGSAQLQAAADEPDPNAGQGE